MTKLTKSEKNEPMMMTWGRIRQLSKTAFFPTSTLKKWESDINRLYLLIEKFNEDLKIAKIEENYFK